MKKLLLVALLLFFCQDITNANPVDQKTAQKVAITHWNHVSPVKADNLAVTDITSQTPFHEFYIFTIGQKGFVIVAADNSVRPILAYSTDAPFVAENMPIQAREWLEDYENQIVYLLDHDNKASNQTQAEWNALLDGEPLSNLVDGDVAPLVSTTWSQGAPYNSMCPGTSDARSVVGCAATAMAQIMRFWNYPISGIGSHSYLHSTYGTQTADFANTIYDWANMPNICYTNSPIAQRNAVATLCYHCGVAIEMDYSPSGSGAVTLYEYNTTYPSVNNALKNHFDYSDSLTVVRLENTTQSNWESLIRTELNLGRPVLYSGRDTASGHAFVCDGYNSTGQFHFNWGWAGYCDGYYAIGSLNPAPGGTGASTSGTYNLNNAMGIKIFPNGALRLSQNKINVSASATTENIIVTSAVNNSSSWTASSNATWVTLTPATGAGSGIPTHVTINIAANNTGSERSAIVTFTQGTQTQQLTISQTSCEESDMCPISITAIDSYGDGWNNATLTIESAEGFVYGTVELISGYNATTTINVCDETVYAVWHIGNYDSECSYSIRRADGSILHNGSPSNSSIAIHNPCSAVPIVCDTVTTYPWVENFTSEQYPCWMFIDGDGDGYGWEISPTGYIMSSSYINNVGPLSPSNWIISPAFTIPSTGNYNLSWYASPTNSYYNREHYSVLISTNGSDTLNFTNIVFSETINYTTSTLREVSLADYAGQTIRFAFHHHNVRDEYAMKISDVTIEAGDPPIVNNYTVTTSANNSSMGSVTGAGTYVEGDTVTLFAEANPGYRFDHWNYNDLTNPFSFIITNDYDFVASFYDLGDDTLHYDNGQYEQSVGTNGGAFGWGIRLRHVDFENYNQLSGIKFYVTTPGAYTINIHQGGSDAPGNIVHSESVNTSISENWLTVLFTNPVDISSNNPIWITLSTTNINYPAAGSTYAGNADGSWTKVGNDNWASLLNYGLSYTWMIRGILGTMPECEDATVTENQTAYGNYTWWGNTYTTSGTYTHTSTGVISGGCDSIYTLHLTILPECEDATVTENQTAYGNYTWWGNTYTTSGTYTHTSTGVISGGCDSIYTLHLTILPECEDINVTETITSDNYYDWWGDTYTTSGTYTHTSTGVIPGGCDSIYTLHLTINNVGINNDATLSNVTVYPNPTHSLLNIEVIENVKAELLDITGRLIATKMLNEGHHQIDLEVLPVGTYLLRISTAQDINILKILKR